MDYRITFACPFRVGPPGIGHNIMKFSIPLLLAIVLLAGCATTATIASRKQERPAAYEALSPEMRSAVDQGLLKTGMDTNAVYLAWGNRAQITHGGNDSTETTTWVYEGSYVQEVRYWGPSRMHYGYVPLVYTRAQVTFTNGVVHQWQTYPVPNY